MGEHYRLNYAPRDRRRATRKPVVGISTVVVAFVALVMNAALLYAAAAERSFLAQGIALAYGPVLNGLLALVSAVAGVAIKRISGGASVAWYLTVAILLPASFAIIDFVVISFLGLHGC